MHMPYGDGIYIYIYIYTHITMTYTYPITVYTSSDKIPHVLIVIHEREALAAATH